MSFFIFSSKVFAVISLIFLSNSFVSAQPDSIYVLPAGKRIKVRMDTEVNSRAGSVNDTFIVRIAEPVRNKGVTLLPAGLIIDGRVSAASAAKIGGVDGRLDVQFVRLRLGRDEAVEMDARLVKPVRPPSRVLFKALTIGGLAAMGAMLGASSDIENGAVVGAAIGAGAGGGIAFIRKGDNVRIRTNEEFEIELKKDLVLPTVEV